MAPLIKESNHDGDKTRFDQRLDDCVQDERCDIRRCQIVIGDYDGMYDT